MYQLKKAGSPFLHLSVLCWPSADWMVPAHAGEGHLLRSVHDSNAVTRLTDTPGALGTWWPCQDDT